MGECPDQNPAVKRQSYTIMEATIKIYKTAETEDMSALYTVEFNGRDICYSLPFHSAIEHLKGEIEGMGEEAA
jgi:hypothetical protein